jgi:hypothetical protein
MAIFAGKHFLAPTPIRTPPPDPSLPEFFYRTWVENQRQKLACKRLGRVF